FTEPPGAQKSGFHSELSIKCGCFENAHWDSANAAKCFAFSNRAEQRGGAITGVTKPWSKP
ncbi:MAG: hypothetical protein KJZ93_27595, partial [Caldilineaceae bacterium]|nr:hypothetical protein [Caldilineaceae bacterium]